MTPQQQEQINTVLGHLAENQATIFQRLKEIGDAIAGIQKDLKKSLANDDDVARDFELVQKEFNELKRLVSK